VKFVTRQVFKTHEWHALMRDNPIRPMYLPSAVMPREKPILFLIMANSGNG